MRKWLYEGEMTMEPDKPPVKFNGTENVRSLGGLWILAEGQGEMPGSGSATTILTLGYDPQRKRFGPSTIGEGSSRPALLHPNECEPIYQEHSTDAL